MAPSKVLAQDVAYWKRLEDGNDQKTYEYLVNAMQRHLDRDQMEKNNSSRRAALQSGRLNPPAVNAASGAGGTGGKPPCFYFHRNGSCKFGERCHASHSPISDEEKKKLKPPSRKGSPDSVRGRGKGTGKGKGNGGPRDRSTSSPTRYWRFFLKGECKNGDKCPFPHFNQEAVGALNHAKGLAKAKAKAKGKPKAKAQATPTQVGSPGQALVMPAPYHTGAEEWKTVVRRSRWSH